MTLAAGQIVLSRYAIEGLLGEGGMGQVYRARHTALDMLVAVKVIAAQHDPEIAQRFEREAKLMARIRHENVVQVLDYGVLDGGEACIVMEYLQGEALDARFERLGALPWPQAVSIARAVLSGLAAVHSAQIVHRDVKPSNVMLLPGPPEVAKLIDFGVARSTKLDATRYTRSGAVLGTPAFMSPEQLLGKPIDARTDVYSVALMLYELISGALPYGGEDMAGVLRRAMGEVPAFEAAAGRPVVPPLLREAILIALEVDPAERPQNAAAFSNMLASAHERSPNHPALVATHVADAVPVGSARPARFLIAARLPPSRLVISAERRWLSEQVQAYGRGFVLGAQHWFALLQVPGRERDERAAVLEAALKTRYGDAAAVATRAVDDELVLSAAALSGAEPLPQPLIELLATL